MIASSYAAAQKRDVRRQFLGFGIVLVLHALLIYGLFNALGRRTIDILPEPIKLIVLAEHKTPPKTLPPPPPQLVTPPPPYIPPPVIQLAPQAATNAITAVSSTPPPAPVVHNNSPPPPAAPDHDVSEVPIGGAAPVYPSRMLEEQREGWASVSCTVDTNGQTSNCAIVATQGGTAFGQSALDFAQSQKYRPATHNGQPIVARKTWKLVFSLS